MRAHRLLDRGSVPRAFAPWRFGGPAAGEGAPAPAPPGSHEAPA
jgi:hypothetical protein